MQLNKNIGEGSYSWSQKIDLAPQIWIKIVGFESNFNQICGIWALFWLHMCEAWRKKAAPYLKSQHLGTRILLDGGGVTYMGWKAWLVTSETGQSQAVLAWATTKFHWQDPSLSSTEKSREEQPTACLSILGEAGSCPGRPATPALAQQPPWKWALSLCWLNT